MFELQTENDLENEHTVVILEAGSPWSEAAQKMRRFAPNSVVFSQFGGESAIAFATRVERRLAQLASEFGRTLRAAAVCAGPVTGPDVSGARELVARALGRAAAEGCIVTVTAGGGLSSDAVEDVRTFARGLRARFERRGVRVVLAPSGRGGRRPLAAIPASRSVRAPASM